MEIKAIDLIPHRPPMLFIDAAAVEGGDITARATVRPDWIILDENGRLSGAAFFEVMAQGFACIAAARAANMPEGERPAANLGFLVGVKKFEVMDRAEAGDVLTVSASNHTEIGPFNIFDATVRRADGAVMAKGQIKVFLTDEEAMRQGTFGEPGI